MALIELIAAAAALTGLRTQAPAPPFPDVPKDHWAFPAVESLRVKGIVHGYPDGNFRGKRTVTRYEAAVGLDVIPHLPGDFAGPPQGPRGERGPKGEPGPQGPPGVRPEVVDELIQLLKSARPELQRLHHETDAAQQKADKIEADVKKAGKI